jgi:uncharacterized protein YecT (DUF1311 family)
MPTMIRRLLSRQVPLALVLLSLAGVTRAEPDGDSAATAARDAARDSAIEAAMTPAYQACRKVTPATNPRIHCMVLEHDRQQAVYDRLYKARLDRLKGPDREAFEHAQAERIATDRERCSPLFKKRGTGWVLAGVSCDLHNLVARRLDLEKRRD